MESLINQLDNNPQEAFPRIHQHLWVRCRLHDINPCVYLVRVQQRVNEYPANKVKAPTPVRWGQKFADNPMRSDPATCC